MSKVSDVFGFFGGGGGVEGIIRLLLLLLLVIRIPISIILCIMENNAFNRQHQDFIGKQLGLNEINVSYQREKVVSISFIFNNNNNNKMIIL